MIPSLHIVTDDEVLSRTDFIPRAMGVMEAGGRLVALHLRGPRTAGRILYSVARTLKAAVLTNTGILLVNDRVDLALALALPGAHLGQRSLPPHVARGILGPERLLGLSVHGVGEAGEAGEGSAPVLDYLFVGTIFSTPSHAQKKPAGTDCLREVRSVTDLPLIAIGGITPERVGDVVKAGAHGIAVRGGVWDAPDPNEATRRYLMELEEAR